MKTAILCALVALATASISAQPVAVPKQPVSPKEERTARRFESIRKDPVALRAFLREMPKGGDLHSHLSGAIYAESYLRWAAEDSLCVDTGTLTILPDREPCDATKNQRAAREAHSDPAFYASLIDAFSVRNHHPARVAGERQFFDSFPHFGPLTQKRKGDMLAEVAHRAAAQNILYLELTSSWDRGVAMKAADAVVWTSDLAVLHQRLLDAGLREAPRTAQLDAAEARLKEVLRCGTPAADPGCAVTIRHQAESYRAFTPVQVFAMLSWAFLQNEADARFVGVNLVQPEHWHVSVRDYALHMDMIDFLHRQHPKVNITLHAGELALGLVPPEVLGTHIEQALQRGHAQRIGHGTDIAYHPRPAALMEDMRRRQVAVEISLSSSDVILGVRGERHPLRSYLRAGVPVVIATDDEGVSRSDLTNEYLRAALEQGLSYRELKRFSRDSVRFSFLDGGTKATVLSRLDRAFTAFER
jgi:adenosine deaminase/adenosine deaminase CECR1